MHGDERTQLLTTIENHTNIDALIRTAGPLFFMVVRTFVVVLIRINSFWVQNIEYVPLVT